MKKRGFFSRAFAVTLIFSLASYPVAVPSAFAGDDSNPSQTSGSENPQPVLTVGQAENKIEQTSAVVPPPSLETQTWQMDSDNPLKSGDPKSEDPFVIDSTEAQWNALTTDEQSRVMTLLVDLENNVDTVDTRIFKNSLNEFSSVQQSENNYASDGSNILRVTKDAVMTVFFGFLKQVTNSTNSSVQNSSPENSIRFSEETPSSEARKPLAVPTLPTIVERLAKLSNQWAEATEAVRKVLKKTVSNVREDGVRKDIKDLADIEEEYRKEIQSDGFGARGFRPNGEMANEDLRAAAVALSIPPRNINPFLRVMFYRNAQEFLDQATEGRREMTQWNRKMIRSSYRHEQKTLFDHYLKTMALLGAKNPVIALLNGKHPRNLFDYLSQPSK